MNWGFKLLFYRLSYIRNMELFLAKVDNEFNVALVFPSMTNCPNFPFHTAILHCYSWKYQRNQSSLKLITVYC